METRLKLAIEAYAEISGESEAGVALEMHRNPEGQTAKNVLLLMFAA